MKAEDEQSASGAYLLGLVGTLAGRKIPIEGRHVVVGRDASQCQIVLDQSVISKTHAAIEFEADGRVVLTDLTSKPMTFVNDQPVTRCELHDGDRVGFGIGGVVAFTFLRGAGVATHPVIVPTAPRPDSFDRPREPVRLLKTGGLTPHVGPQQPVHQATTIVRLADVPVLRIGRAPDNDVLLDAPGVSRHHAMLSYQNQSQPLITDLGSTNGTFVNGEPVSEPRILSPRDLVFIGGFLLSVDGRNIKRHDLSASRITAFKLTKEIARKTILNDISIAVYPREFVGLMGPSGCGKSTLMDALNGLRPATSGAVFVNDLDLYKNFDAIRRSIGYVPQRDILHDSLTVERTLYYGAKLRLPESTSRSQMTSIVSDVIEIVGLSEHRATPFRQLSGGQQKRLSLALELITKPSFIFLDEPTSPLDPETTENMMVLFRRLADEGRIVVMVTHKFEKFDEMHHIAMLTKGGRLAFFGPPREALEYFGCTVPGDIYRNIGARDADELKATFERSPYYRRYVSGRIEETRQLTSATGALGNVRADEQAGQSRPLGVKQWLTLTQRYLEVKLKDRRNTLLLFAQAPIVAIILAIIAGDQVNASKTLFIAAIVSIWFGANNAIREIVSETPIYVRERLVNLKIPSYVFSKFAVLSGIAFIQSLLFVGIIIALGKLSTDDCYSLTAILYLTSLAGVAIGLFFSALVNSTEKAMSILPLVLIPQLLLSGYLQPLDDVYYSAEKPATIQEFRKYEDSRNKAPVATGTSSMPAQTAPVSPIFKRNGMGLARYAAALMVARWTIEALVHDVSINDKKARDGLGREVSVVGYQAVFDGKTEAQIASEYRFQVGVDTSVLALFILAFLGLTVWALKRKDVL